MGTTPTLIILSSSSIAWKNRESSSYNFDGLITIPVEFFLTRMPDGTVFKLFNLINAHNPLCVANWSKATGLK